MDLNFAEFLEEYVPIMPESVQDGVLKRMTYSENLTKISFYIAFSHLVPAQDLIALEHELEIRLAASTLYTRIVHDDIFPGSGHVSETGNDCSQRIH